MTLERVKKLLDKEYERAKKRGVQKPLTSALYLVWRSVDRSLGIKRFTVTESGETIIEYEGEDERLKAQRYMTYPDGRLEMIPTVESVRADTVREMRSEIESRCIKGGIYPAFVRSTIEQIAREMIGEGNE
jgi:hypothetical protein